jgi:putative ABC transport system permease protein
MGSGSSRQIWASSHAPLATMAKREIPEVREAVRTRECRQYSLFQYKDKRFTGNNACYIDPSFFSVFDFKLREGDPVSPFQGDHSVILTVETAKRYFGAESPLGKILQADNKEQFVVCGVVENFPENSSIHYDMLFPMSLSAKLVPDMEADWGNFNYTTYLQLQPQSSEEVVANKLAASLRKNYRDIGFDDPYRLQPLTEMHLYKADGSEGFMQTVRIFLIVGMLILLIACINYVNIATARSMLRAREVSVRKMIGAGKAQLFLQFVVETALVFLLAMAAAMVLARFLMPLYNSISGKDLAFDLTDQGIWLLMGVIMLSALVLSSIYPALLLSSFEPLKVLKGKLSGGISTTFYRKLLVTVQFMFSVARWYQASGSFGSSFVTAVKCSWAGSVRPRCSSMIPRQ